MDTTAFARTKGNQQIHKFILRSRSGFEVHILNYGATIQKLLVPHNDGSMLDIVLGFEDLAAYEDQHPYFGSIIGRNANRLKDAKIRLEDRIIQLSQNEGNNQLHGGFSGFGKKKWDFEQNGEQLLLRYTSAHGEEGYPGNLNVEASFQWRGDTLVMGHRAETDRVTAVNLTRHEYFNLGAGENIRDHRLSIYADHYLPIDQDELPTGEIAAVEGTPMKLNGAATIGEKLNEMHSGYNHNYVLNNRRAKDPAAVLLSPDDQLKLSLFCTQPGLQFYSADNLGQWNGKYGKIAPQNPALCLEPQHFPDAFAHSHFPSTVLHPDMVYQQEIRYQLERI